MYRFPHCLIVAFVAVLSATCWRATAHAELDAAMLRFPDVSADRIVFVYDNDVWLAPREGGMAIPLSSPAGMEILPRFSPDGSKVAFTANYDGNHDVYEMPSHGGIPKRLTYEPSGDMVVDYSPDGRVMFSSAWQIPHESKLYYASPEGKLPEALPVAYGAFGSISADGQWLAFSPWTTEFRTWNRYQGGWATDIWLFNLKTHESRQMTDFPGTDDMPMFVGDRVYFLSDCGEQCRRNIFYYDIATGTREQVTFFADYDVRWPAAGPTDIIFENGGNLYLMDLATLEPREVTISVPGDHPHLRAQSVDVSGFMDGASISPGGKRVAAQVRGDIWTMPAEKGYPVNLTDTDGVAERDPSWSPDGNWIAYICDSSGEYELCIRPADGSGAEKQLTSDSDCFRFSPRWSPDSKKIGFSDKTGAYFIHIVDGETIKVDRDEWGGWGLAGTWAKDSNWFAYTVSDPETSNGVIRFYDLTTRQSTQITSSAFNTGNPTFDVSGDYMFFTTDRNFEPLLGSLDDGESFFFTNSTVLGVLPLRKDIPSPFAPKNDEDEAKPEEGKSAEGDDAKKEGAGEGEKKDGEGKDEKEADKPVEPLKIDLESIETRAVLLPLQGGSYWNLKGGDKKLFFLQGSRNGAGGDPQLKSYDLKEQKEETLLPGVYGFELTPDGTKMLAYAQGKLFITGSAPGAALDKPVNMAGLTTTIDPREEWQQVIMDTWRIYRDFFYDPNLHGVDWPRVRDRALYLVQYAANREDVQYIIEWMASELNTSHTYVWAPSSEQQRWTSCGMLGCDFELGKDGEGREAYRISRIYHGADWEIDARGPLMQPGVDVREGDFLLAVNGKPVSTAVSPYAALQGLAGQPTSITVSDKAVIDDSARKALVQPQGDEYELRLRDWIEKNRQYVSDQTGGKVGYIYIRNTSWEGLIDLQRQFLGQHNKEGVVIDERWNGGGFIPHRFIEMLNRPVRSYWARRDGLSWRTPYQTIPGPKVMLVNYAAGSGGDAFPYYFRQAGLGKLIGTRTWGGLVGISGNPQLIDGGGLTVPTFGIYELDGTWGIEGHGVDPDIEVVNDPTSLAQGRDLQLDKAIEVVLQEIEQNPYRDVPKPPYPDRSRSGVLEGDK